MDCYDNGSSHDNDYSDNSNEFARVNRVVLSKSSEEYRQRRERNNAAVKKSRFKSKQKTLETQRRVDQLKDENSQLERRVETLQRELDFMRNIFVPRRPGLQPQRLVQPGNLTSKQIFTVQQDENNINQQGSSNMLQIAWIPDYAQR